MPSKGKERVLGQNIQPLRRGEEVGQPPLSCQGAGRVLPACHSCPLSCVATHFPAMCGVMLAPDLSRELGVLCTFSWAPANLTRPS